MQLMLTTTTETGEGVENSIASVKDDSMENQVLNIYGDLTYQTMEGFGGALTDAAGYVFSRMSEEQKDYVLNMYFGENTMGYNRVRIPMDSCDFATHMYEADPREDDEELLHFTMEETEKYILPLLRAAQKKAGKQLNIMLSPWSPPAYMKTNKSRVGGGKLKPQYYQRWAEYLCRYIEEFQRRGFLVERMSIQNEPHAVQTWDSCIYSAGEEKMFLKEFLAPALKRHGLGQIEVFIWDHNKERAYERIRDVADEATDLLVDGVAFHWYSGDHFEILDMIQKQYPGKKMILSESCLEFSIYDKRDEVPNAERLAHDMIGNLNHGMTGFYDWNILLDEKGGPNHVGNYCDAPFLFNMEENKLEERRCLKYYWHFCHFIKPGAVRMASSKYTDKLDFTAWKNPDGQTVYVLLNRTGKEMPCHLRYQGEAFTFAAPPHSISSGRICAD